MNIKGAHVRAPLGHGRLKFSGTTTKLLKISFSGTVIFPVVQTNKQGDFQLK